MSAKNCFRKHVVFFCMSAIVFLLIGANNTLAQSSPTITSTPVEAVAVGYTYEYDVDADGDPVPTYGLAGEPDGMTIDPLSGEIEWFPADRQDGDHAFSAIATNTEGSDPQSITASVYDLCDATVGDMTAYWKLEEEVLERPPYDDYIGANDGTCTFCPTASAVSGVVGNYQIFNGGDSGIRIPASVTGDGVFDWGEDDSFSIELWVKRSAGDIRNENEVMIGRDEDATAGVHWWVGLSGANDGNEGKVVFVLNDTDDAAGVNWVTSDISIANNQWHHIVVVRDDVAGQNLMYVDGVLQLDVETVAYDAGFGSVDESVDIGFLDINVGAVPDARFFFDGQLDEIALYKIALPADIAAQHYEQVPDRGYCNVPPVITTTAPNTATEDVEYTYNPTATDTEMDTITWSLENEPVGMIIVPATGAITWTPGNVLTSGLVTLIANDGFGGTGTEEVIIAVTPVDDDDDDDDNGGGGGSGGSCFIDSLI